MLEHYLFSADGDFLGANPEWLRASLSEETEGSLLTHEDPLPPSRVVSRDAVQGCAPMESEVVTP